MDDLGVDFCEDLAVAFEIRFVGLRVADDDSVGHMYPLSSKRLYTICRSLPLSWAEAGPAQHPSMVSMSLSLPFTRYNITVVYSETDIYSSRA